MSMAADRLYRNASGSRGDSDISSIWERKQMDESGATSEKYSWEDKDKTAGESLC